MLTDQPATVTEVAPKAPRPLRLSPTSLRNAVEPTTSVNTMTSVVRSSPAQSRRLWALGLSPACPGPFDFWVACAILLGSIGPPTSWLILRFVHPIEDVYWVRRWRSDGLAVTSETPRQVIAPQPQEGPSMVCHGFGIVRVKQIPNDAADILDCHHVRRRGFSRFNFSASRPRSIFRFSVSLGNSALRPCCARTRKKPGCYGVGPRTRPALRFGLPGRMT